MEEQNKQKYIDKIRSSEALFNYWLDLMLKENIIDLKTYEEIIKSKK